MRKLNANRNFISDESTWCFLTEFSLFEFLADHDRREAFTAGFIFQSVRELGLSPEWAENIEMTLAKSATEALARSKQGAFVIPWRIRVFCQKKTIEIDYSESTSDHSKTEKTIEPAAAKHYSSAKVNGGWGYFVIERGDYFSANTTMASNYCVDLYIYREGE